MEDVGGKEKIYRHVPVDFSACCGRYASLNRPAAPILLPLTLTLSTGSSRVSVQAGAWAAKALLSSIRTTKAAPSLVWDEVAAVTLPPSWKAGLRAAS